jgi:GNAT superfamily N-acetyltransferase
MEITIRRYTNSDWVPVCTVILNTVYKVFPKDQPRKAISIYESQFHPIKGTARKDMQTRGRVTFVACKGKKIIGVIRGRPGARIGQLYVAEVFQGKGVGRALLHTFFTYSKKKGERIGRVRATRSAVPFYQKVGFRRVGGIRRGKDFIYQPMRIVLS